MSEQVYSFFYGRQGAAIRLIIHDEKEPRPREPERKLAIFEPSGRSFVFDEQLADEFFEVMEQAKAQWLQEKPETV